MEKIDMTMEEKVDYLYFIAKKEEKRRWYRMYYRICLFILVFILPYYIFLMYGPMLMQKALSGGAQNTSKDYINSIVNSLSPEQKKAIENNINNLLNTNQNSGDGTSY